MVDYAGFETVKIDVVMPGWTLESSYSLANPALAAVPPGCCAAFVSADDYAKKIKEVDEMFGAVVSKPGFTKENFYRYVWAVPYRYFWAFIGVCGVLFAVTFPLFWVPKNQWHCTEKNGQCSHTGTDAIEGSC